MLLLLLLFHFLFQDGPENTQNSTPKKSPKVSVCECVCVSVCACVCVCALCCFYFFRRTNFESFLSSGKGGLSGSVPGSQK